MALLIRRTDQENYSDLWHSPTALQMSLFINDLLRTIDALLSIAIRTTFTNKTARHYESMSCYSLTTLELAFATANLRLYDPLRNIDTYALNTYPRYLSLTTLETACYSTAVLLER